MQRLINTREKLVTRQLVLKQVMALFYLLLWVSPATAEENFISHLNKAFESKKGMPHISAIEPTISETAAYKIQKNYVESRSKSDPVAGYKAGLTSKAGQKKFSVSQSLSGVLFSSGHLSNPQEIKLSSAGKLMLETEIGFILATDITAPIKDRSEIPQHIESILGVVELPDLAFENPKGIKGVDLMAANLASHQYILGKQFELSKIGDINALETNLAYNQKLLFKGKATDALGDQWAALNWLINHLLNSGYSLKAGDILITGSLGKMIPAQTGNYQADFGELGKIEFQINP